MANLVALAECGFYDGQSFHRVVPGFVAQAGDPQTKTNHGDFEGIGSGGPGYQFEIELPPESTSYTRYMVAMANAMHFGRAARMLGPLRKARRLWRGRQAMRKYELLL